MKRLVLLFLIVHVSCTGMEPKPNFTRQVRLLERYIVSNNVEQFTQEIEPYVKNNPPYSPDLYSLLARFPIFLDIALQKGLKMPSFAINIILRNANQETIIALEKNNITLPIDTLHRITNTHAAAYLLNKGWVVDAKDKFKRTVIFCNVLEMLFCPKSTKDIEAYSFLRDNILYYRFLRDKGADKNILDSDIYTLEQKYCYRDFNKLYCLCARDMQKIVKICEEYRQKKNMKPAMEKLQKIPSPIIKGYNDASPSPTI